MNLIRQKKPPRGLPLPMTFPQASQLLMFLSSQQTKNTKQQQHKLEESTDRHK